MNSRPDDDASDLIEVFCRVDVQVRIFENGQPPYLGFDNSRRTIRTRPLRACQLPQSRRRVGFNEQAHELGFPFPSFKNGP